ncbi:hypothetical protein PEC106568_10890 [Pectobacterium carotovorum subsp. carotovorum]|nr:hypothetical protein PEC106568_10890 [Pectobacterium carotovorum subsp. carotovorum]
MPINRSHSLLYIFQHTDTVDIAMRKAQCEHSESLSNLPKHKINHTLNLISILTKIRDLFTNNLNGNAR